MAPVRLKWGARHRKLADRACPRLPEYLLPRGSGSLFIFWCACAIDAMSAPDNLPIPADGWHYLDAQRQSQGPFSLEYLQSACGGVCPAWVCFDVGLLIRQHGMNPYTTWHGPRPVCIPQSCSRAGTSMIRRCFGGRARAHGFPWAVCPSCVARSRWPLLRRGCSRRQRSWPAQPPSPGPPPRQRRSPTPPRRATSWGRSWRRFRRWRQTRRWRPGRAPPRRRPRSRRSPTTTARCTAGTPQRTGLSLEARPARDPVAGPPLRTGQRTWSSRQTSWTSRSTTPPGTRCGAARVWCLVDQRTPAGKTEGG